MSETPQRRSSSWRRTLYTSGHDRSEAADRLYMYVIHSHD
jgi:hypothetical protein